MVNRIVFFILIMYYGCSSAVNNLKVIQDDSNIDFVWKSFFYDVCTLNLDSVKNNCTENSFVSLMRSNETSNYDDKLRFLCNQYSDRIIEIEKISEDEIKIHAGTLNPENGYYPSAFVFMRINSKWKLSKYLPSK